MLIFSVVICELAFLAFVDFYRIHLEEAAIFRDEELLAREEITASTAPTRRFRFTILLVY